MPDSPPGDDNHGSGNGLPTGIAGFSPDPALPGLDLPCPGWDPAWRWHRALSRLLEGTDQGWPSKEVGPTPDSAEDDPVIAQYLAPYLAIRCEGFHPVGLARRDYLALHQSLAIWSRRGREFQSLPYLLEAGILAGREAGSLLATEPSLDSRTQRFYEAVFFAVRGRLADRGWVLRAVFAASPATSRTAAWGEWMKLLAYALGRDEFTAWMNGEEVARARYLAGLLERILAYLNGLKSLGIMAPDDRLNWLSWLLGQADAWEPGTVLPASPGQALAAFPGWREKLAELAEAIPAPARAEGLKKRAAASRKRLADPGEG